MICFLDNNKMNKQFIKLSGNHLRFTFAHFTTGDAAFDDF